MAIDFFVMPSDFEQPFEMTSPRENTTGSVPRALRELAEGPWPSGTEHAIHTLRNALNDAAELQLPMIVDE